MGISLTKPAAGSEANNLLTCGGHLPQLTCGGHLPQLTCGGHLPQGGGGGGVRYSHSGILRYFLLGTLTCSLRESSGEVGED